MFEEILKAAARCPEAVRLEISNQAWTELKSDPRTLRYICIRSEDDVRFFGLVVKVTQDPVAQFRLV